MSGNSLTKFRDDSSFWILVCGLIPGYMLFGLRMVLTLLAVLEPESLRVLDEELMIVQIASVSVFERSDVLIFSRSLITSVFSATFS